MRLVTFRDAIFAGSGAIVAALIWELRCGGGGGGGGDVLKKVKNATTLATVTTGTTKPLSPFPASSHPQLSGGDPVVAARILLDGGPSIVNRRISDVFVSEFDGQTRNPRWVVQLFEKKGDATIVSSETPSPPPLSRNGIPFKEDTSIPTSHRALLSAYSGSGYDRGHLVPAADTKRAGITSLTDSFTMSNISPQKSSLNREWWASLESWVRGVAGEWPVVRVVTGPAFLPTPTRREDGSGGWKYAHAAIGEAGAWVAVPSHFYKVILATNPHDGTAAVAVFLVPHDPPPRRGRLYLITLFPLLHWRLRRASTFSVAR